MNQIAKLVQLEKEAVEFGLKWSNTEQILQQIQSECVEVQEHLQTQSENYSPDLQEEIGDLLHAVYSLCVFCKLDPEQTLENTVSKFELRFKMMKLIAHENGINNVQGLSFNELMVLWDQAKEKTR